MKKIITILLIAASLGAAAQSETHNFVTYDTLMGTFNSYTWQARITRPVNYFTPNNIDTASRPILLFMPGQGEGNSNYAGLQTYGGHYWLNNGWDGSIVTGNGTHYPIIITVKPTAANPRINSAINMLTALKNKFHPKNGKFHAAGLSMGAFTWAGTINGQLTAGGEEGMKLFESLVLLQGDGQGATSGIMGGAIAYDATGYTAFGHWASKYGGTFFGLEGTNDSRTVWRPRDNINDSVSGAGYFAFENIGGGGHCCWNTMYDPSQKNWKNAKNDLGTNITWNNTHPNTMGTYVNGWSVFEWMFRQGDTTLVGSGGGNNPPVVDAGANQTIYYPTSSANLSGSATDEGGTLTYLWEKISGNTGDNITTPNNQNTTVTGLTVGSYTYKLTVTDTGSLSGSDLVNITVIDTTSYPSPSGKKIVGPGEYQSYFIDKNGYLWGIGNITNIGTNNTGTLGIAYRSQVTPSDLKFSSVAGGLHGGAAVDTSGHVWVLGDNDQYQMGIGNNTQPIYTPQKITTDSAGNDFKNVKSIAAYFVKDGGNGYNGFYAIKNDGTLWGWGRMVFGMRGDGTPGADKSRPVQITMPGGRLVKQIVAGQFTIALCTDSTVWVWGQGASDANIGYGGGSDTLKWSPKQLTGLTGITQIAGGMLWNYALDGNGVLYGWGSYGERMGNANGLPIATPTPLNNITNNLPSPIKKIVTNSSVTHVILADSTLWGWGDNGQGTVGNGQRLNFQINGGNPFNRNNLDVVLPVQIAPGIKFDSVFGGSTYTYHTYARDVNDSLYSWGRGKGAVLANKLQPANANITAIYGNTWDIAYPTPVDPFNIGTAYIQTSDYCVKVSATGSPCNGYVIPANTKPTANAGSDQSIGSVTQTTLDGTGSTDNVFISRYEWSQVSGPSTSIIDLPASKTPTVRNLVDGNYVFKLLVEDNGWMLDSSTVNITVGSSDEIPVITSYTSSADTIQLPTSTVTLTFTATDAEGSVNKNIVVQAAPGGASVSIGAPSGNNYTVTGMTSSGNYIFRAYAEDNIGQSVYEDLTVVVLPASGSGSQMSYKVNVYGGTNPQVNGHWFNWNITSGDANNINDTTGATSNIGLSITIPGSIVTNSLQTGVMCPDTVLLNASYTTQTRELTITGLEAGALYSFEFYCSRNINAVTTFTQNGNSKGVNVQNNTSTPVIFTDITPTGNQVVFSISGNNPQYLNGFKITRQGTSTPINNPPVANAGSDIIIILPADSTGLNGTGSGDSDGTIVSYQWTLISSQTGVLFTNQNSSTTGVYNMALADVYTYRLTVTDNDGATNSDDVSVYVLPEEFIWRGYKLNGRRIKFN